MRCVIQGNSFGWLCHFVLFPLSLSMVSLVSANVSEWLLRLSFVRSFICSTQILIQLADAGCSALIPMQLEFTTVATRPKTTKKIKYLHRSWRKIQFSIFRKSDRARHCSWFNIIPHVNAIVSSASLQWNSATVDLLACGCLATYLLPQILLMSSIPCGVIHIRLTPFDFPFNQFLLFAWFPCAVKLAESKARENFIIRTAENLCQCVKSRYVAIDEDRIGDHNPLLNKLVLISERDWKAIHAHGCVGERYHHVSLWLNETNSVKWDEWNEHHRNYTPHIRKCEF